MEKLLKLFGTAAFMLSVTAFAEAAPFSSIPLAAKASPVFLKIPVLKKLLSSTVALGKCRHALPEKEIEHLAEIARHSGGVKEVGVILGKSNLPGKFGKKAGELVLHDTYLRIALKNGHISRSLAADAMKHLRGTPGFTALLRKINSASPSQVKGHLRELEIAVCAKQKGFKALSLGEKFSDGIKKGDTDLDILLRRGSINYAIESKAYSGKIPHEMVRADAGSLLAFCQKNKNTVPVFCFENAPSRFTMEYLKKNNIKVIYGTAQDIAAALRFTII